MLWDVLWLGSYVLAFIQTRVHDLSFLSSSFLHWKIDFITIPACYLKENQTIHKTIKKKSYKVI